MKKYVVIVVLLLVAILLFLPIIPGTYVYTTAAQDEKIREFCSQRGCGLMFEISPFEYARKSLYNAIVRD
jgi:hypothetical protein